MNFVEHKAGKILINVLAIDLGTSKCRSAIVNENLVVSGFSIAEYPIINKSSVQIEQDANLWWDSVIMTSQEAIASSGCDRRSIRAIAISSQGISFVPVDINGNALMNVFSWLDMRAENEEIEFENKFGFENIYSFSGKRSSCIYSLPKMIWFRKHCSEIYHKSWKLLLPLDYIQMKLCGQCITDYTCASGTMVFDIIKRTWSEEILSEYDIDINKLSIIQESGSIAGSLRPDIAKTLGLEQNVIVAVGGQDQKCASYGAGITESIATVSLGTAAAITMLCAYPVMDLGCRIPVFSYLFSDSWVLEGSINTCCNSYSWFQKEFADGLSFEELDELAASAKVTDQPTFFYPYFLGAASPHWNKGNAAFTGISLNTTKNNFAKSILEGIACNIRSNIEVMESVYKTASELRVFGGGSKGAIFNQLIADITNKTVVTFKSHEVALVGAAKLALRSLGLKEQNENAVLKVYEPFQKSVDQYSVYYKSYQETRRKLYEE